MTTAPLTLQIADEAPPQPKKVCPLHHGLVTYTVQHGAIMLDWHRARNERGVWDWCSGSDLNLTDWQECRE